MSLGGKTVIVTGAASGIGFACVEKLLDKKARVIAADITPFPTEKLPAEFSVSGQLASVNVDVREVGDLKRMVAAGLSATGRIDALIHSAGVGVEKSFLRTTPEDWQRILDIDLSGTFYCNQAVAAEMVKSGQGRIVNIASTAGVVGSYKRAAYGAAKGGVLALTKVIATELAPFGITANALAPGAIDTELVTQMHSAQTRQIYTDRIPQGRYGTPEEVADAAIFLASDAASYINGQILGVDGGFLSAGLMEQAQ